MVGSTKQYAETWRTALARAFRVLLRRFAVLGSRTLAEPGSVGARLKLRMAHTRALSPKQPLPVAGAFRTVHNWEFNFLAVKLGGAERTTVLSRTWCRRRQRGRGARRW
jgi:hypothetical protein